VGCRKLIKPKAQQIINIIEGFKLGSLGVSKLGKHKPIEEKPDTKTTKVSGFSKVHDTSYVWMETLEPEWVHPFRTIKDWIGYPIRVNFFLRKVSSGNYKPAVDVFLEMDKKEKLVNIGSFNYTRFHFQPGEGASWMKNVVEYRAKPMGLKGLGFPDLWEEDR
jgi:hypothetical protein